MQNKELKKMNDMSMSLCGGRPARRVGKKREMEGWICLK
jgi:hypothetical protein